MPGEAMTWEFDANVGIYKNWQLTDELRKLAAGACIVAPFTHAHGINFKPNAGEGATIQAPAASLRSSSVSCQFL